MYYRGLLLVVAIAASGCAATFGTNQMDTALISGVDLFGEEVAPAAPIDIIAPSPAMVEFVSEEIRAPHLGMNRFMRLMGKLRDHGFLHNDYLQTATQTAADTFRTRTANCLGYTNMFVALAREAGLQAEYQLIESRPDWESEGGMLIRNNHINVLISNVTSPGFSEAEITVDFNQVNYDTERVQSRIVSDAYAESLFYSNLSVDYLNKGDYRDAFALLKRAIMTAPNNKSLWSNLGYLFSSNNRPDLAERAYAQSLRIDRNFKSALSGMVVALRSQDKHAEAEELARKVKGYHRKSKRRRAITSDMIDRSNS